MEEFNLKNSEYVELKNLMKLMGLCDSGGEAMAVIAEGRVRVDGKVELRKRCKIRTGQTVEFKGRAIIVK